MGDNEKHEKATSPLLEVAGLFLRLGFTAFGGPAAHIAMMEREVVEKRKWMTQQQFLDLVGATNLIPGPNSTEMTMHCGYERAGKLGLFVAGACFIFPAVLLTGLLAFIYVNYGKLPEIEPFFTGIKPAVLVIIAAAVYKLGKKALKNRTLYIIAIPVVAGALLGANELYALLLAGVAGMFWLKFFNAEKKASCNSLFTISMIASGSGGSALFSAISTTGVFLVFLKVGAVLFGSGYVLLAYLEAELVNNLGWLTREQLLDAVAMGQFTPGPVLSTSTFIGYQINGIPGAVAATLGIFLPSFLFVLFLNPLVPKYS